MAADLAGPVACLVGTMPLTTKLDGPSRLLPAADREGILAWTDELDSTVIIRVTAWSEVRLLQSLCQPEGMARWLDELPEKAPGAVVLTLEVCGQLL
jgi:hypothetical protein